MHGNITKRFQEIKQKKEASEDFLENLGDVIKDYDTKLMMSGNTDIISVSDYLPRYTNKAVNFTGDDMGSDKATIMLFDYIVVVNCICIRCYNI